MSETVCVACGDFAGALLPRIMRLGPSPCIRSAICLMFRTMSVTSSRTPAIEENSCSTPSICTALDRRALQGGKKHAAKRIPERQAKPTLERLGDDSGDAPGVVAGGDFSLFGLISSCQFFWIVTFSPIALRGEKAPRAHSAPWGPNGTLLDRRQI